MSNYPIPTARGRKSATGARAWAVTRPTGATWLAAGVVALSVALPLPVHGAIAHLPTVCLLRHWTGIPCPACGLTRAFVCLAHGHWHEAILNHPLSPLLFGATAVFAAVGVFKPAYRWPPRVQALAMTGTLAVLAIFGLWRAAGHYPWPL